MLRLTRLADYAVVIMSHMAKDPGRIHNASEIASGTGVHTPTVSKVLGVMSRGGLVQSRRGKAGGFFLARSPDAITVAEIVGLVDGPISLTECVEDAPGHCDLESICAVRGYWQKINDAVRRALEDVTLADLACPALTFPMVDSAQRRPAGKIS